MNVLRLHAEAGCASDQLSGIGKIPYDIFRIQNTLYARFAIGDHKTMSSDLKPHNIWMTICEHWRGYHKGMGEILYICKRPSGKNQRRVIKNAKITRTLLIRKDLIDTGVLKK